TGLAPLSGIVTPFLSYGKSSMIVNFALLGLIAAVSARTESADASVDEKFGMPMRVASAAAFVLLAAVGWRAADIQLIRADDLAVRPTLVPRASGERAFAYNPRIFAAREVLGRGTIRDRNGIILAIDSGRSEVLPDSVRPAIDDEDPRG